MKFEFDGGEIVLDTEVVTEAQLRGIDLIHYATLSANITYWIETLCDGI